MASFSFRAVVALLLAMVVVVLVFSLGFGGGFIFDDIPNIVENTSLHLHSFDVVNLPYAVYSFQGMYGARSLSMLSFVFDYWHGALDPSVFKRTNLIIHLASVLALVCFLRLLLLHVQWSKRQAMVGAILLASWWALHPLQVSSVLYVVQRMQTMVTLFMVLGLLSYLAMRRAQLDDRRSRHFALLVLFFWLLGIASKEDGILLPLYALGLEVMVLHFNAANPVVEKMWRRGYQCLVFLGILLFFFVVIPHYWHWDFYPGRDFSSVERLLTQGRILVMYLVQIFLPFPGWLPFYYDDVIVSRSLWQPITTVSAWLLLGALLALGWGLRRRRPIFSLGIWLFFAGHLITSNVVNLELAFEHRNHFPMVGVALILGDVGFYCYQRWKIRPPIGIGVVCALLLCMTGATAVRAHAWGEPLRFARWSTQVAPHSTRAWLELCTAYFVRSGDDKKSPFLDQAISTCQQGAELTNAPTLLSNVVIFKTIKGSVNEADWNNFLKRLGEVPMSAQNQGILAVTLNNLDKGILLDERGVLRTIDLIADRAVLDSSEYIRIGAYIYNETHQPRRAFDFFAKAVLLMHEDDAQAVALLQQLTEAGRDDWVQRLRQMKRGGL